MRASGIPRRAGTALAAVVMAIAFAPSAGATTATDQRFVPDAVAQFDALTLRPDGLAFDPGTSPTPTLCQHYQGVARGQGADGTPYLFITRSGLDLPACIDDDTSGTLIVVRLGSREKTGERLRSNRLRLNWAIDNPFWPTPPDTRDVVVTSINLDGTGWPAYRHPGGMQLIDNVLAIGTENPFGGGERATILFVDVSNPEAPQLRSQMDLDLDSDAFGADPVGLTAIKNPEGKCCLYLMIVAGGPANEEIRFFRSLPTGGGTTDLASPDLGWEQVARHGVLPGITEFGVIAGCSAFDWPINTDLVPGVPRGSQHQMLNFVRQGGLDGPLYLVAGRNTLGPLGSDFIDLYRVNLNAAGDGTATCPLTLLRTTNVDSHPFGGGGDSANLAAASGAYVSPSGELMVYATEHHNEGPFRMNADGSIGTRRTVRFTEFRHRHVVRPDSPTLQPTAKLNGPFAVDEGSSIALTGSGEQALTKAWIQLYEDSGAGTSLPGILDDDEWLAVDYSDRDADNYGDLEALDDDSQLSDSLDFAENADSWRWFAPVGCTIGANDFPDYSPNFPGPDTVLLPGTGQVEVEDDLEDIDYEDDVGGITFDCDAYYGATIGLGWDLDGNGSYEVSGTSATFDASSLDGPTSRAIGARAQHPTDTTPLGIGAPLIAAVQVRNVAPQIGPAQVTSGSHTIGDGVPAFAGVPLTLEVTFTDPGRADTQTAVVDWDDGTIDTAFDAYSDAQGGAVGRLEQAHTFAAGGTYDVVVTITDDDGGATPAVVTIEVRSLEAVADDLRDLIAANPGTQLATKLKNAVAKLDDAANSFAAGERTLALSKLEGTVRELEALVQSGLLAAAVAQPFLVELTIFADVVSETAIVEAEAAGASAGKIADAKAANARGDALRIAGKYADAVSEYKHAASKVE